MKIMNAVSAAISSSAISAPIDPIKEALIDAGFAGIEIDVLPIDKPVADLALFGSGLIFGNPVVDQIRARGGPTPEALRDELLDDLRREFGEKPTVIPLQTIFYSAIKPR